MLLPGAISLVLCCLPYLPAMLRLFDLGAHVGLWSPATLRLLASSASLALVTSCASIALGVLLLVLLAVSRGRWTRMMALLGVVFVFGVSPVVNLAAWQELAGGLSLSPMATTVIVLAASYCAIPTLLLVLGLFRLDLAGTEAAALCAPYGKVVRHILLPQLRLPLLAAGALVFAMSFTHGEVTTLTGYPVYAEEFLARIVLSDDPLDSAAAALPQVSVALFLVPLLHALGKNVLSASWRPGLFDRITTLIPYSSCCITFLALSTVFLLPAAMVARAGFEGVFDKHGVALASTVPLAMSSAMLATIMARAIADMACQLGNDARALVLTVLLVQVLLPGSLMALGTIELSQVSGLTWLRHGDTLMVLSHAFRVAPLLVIVLVGIHKVPDKGEQAFLAMMSVTRWYRFLHLQLPRQWPEWVLAFGLGFILTLSELPTTVLTVAPGTETVILRLYNLMHYGAWDGVKGLACVQGGLIVLIGGACFGGWWWGRPRGRA